MLTTHMDPQLTGSDVVTTEDGHLLTLNQVMELGKIEHKSKPTIVKKEFNWELSPISRFRRTANSSPWRVGGQIRETFWSGRKGPGFTEPPKNWRGKGEDPKLEKAIEPTREADNRLSPSRMGRFIVLMVGLLDE